MRLQRVAAKDQAQVDADNIARRWLIRKFKRNCDQRRATYQT